jgi:DNA replication protein DnaC
VIFVIDEGQLRMTENTEVCGECFGTGTKIDPLKGATPCPCRRPERSKKALAAARIPPRYAKCTFESFKRPPGSPQDNNVLKAQKIVDEYPAVDKGLLLMGPSGVGKTHIAVAMLKELIRKGFGGVFCEFGALLKQIQDSYNPISKTSEVQVLAPVYETDVLVLDELGATIPTDWVRDTMYQIINRRYSEEKFTIFTTNYFDARHTDKDQVLEDRIGTRLRSRLYEMCAKVVMDGGDYRRLGDQGR